MAKKQSKRKKQRKKHDWEAIRLAYVTREDRPSQPKLAKEFKAPEREIAERSRKEGWVKQREAHRRDIAEKVQRKLAQNQTKKELNRRKIVRSVLAGVLAQIRGKMSCPYCGGELIVPKVKAPSYGDYEKIQKLEMLICSDLPTERIEDLSADDREALKKLAQLIVRSEIRAGKN